MGFLDRFRKQVSDVTEQAQDLAAEHADTVKEGVGKAADFVDEKTGEKYSGHIDKVEGVVDDVVDKIAGVEGEAEAEPAGGQPASPSSSG